MTRHQWSVNLDDTRICSVCKRRELLCEDDWGSQWIPTRPGEEAAHSHDPLLYRMDVTDERQGVVLGAVVAVLVVALVIINMLG